jgi:hypothetical protein
MKYKILFLTLKLPLKINIYRAAIIHATTFSEFSNADSTEKDADRANENACLLQNICTKIS